MSPLPATETDALKEARIRAAQLHADFATVFGHPHKRTPAQGNVLGHLAVCAGDDANAYRFNEAKDGVALVAAGIHRDGAKSILRVIDKHLALAATQKTDKPKTKTKR